MSENNESPSTPTTEVNDCRVYVGNLAFHTTEDTLRQVFAKCGEIVEATISTRTVYPRGSRRRREEDEAEEAEAEQKQEPTRRSLGYGFVTFALADYAQKALDTLDRAEIEGRPITVKLARPPLSDEEKQKKREELKAKRQAKFQEKKEAAAARAQEEGATSAAGEEGAAREEAQAAKKAAKKKASRQRRKEKKAVAEQEDAAAEESATNAPAAAPRQPRVRVPLSERQPSKIAIYLSNVPFHFDSALLGEFISAQGFQPTKANVAIRRFKNGATRSKGFAFVEFASEEEQLRAVEALNGIEVEGRAIQVKVAMDRPDYVQAEGNTGNEAAPAEVEASA